MKKEMLINVLQPEEIRIAIVEDGVLEELYVERTSHESYVGNIYKGRIVNIEPSIQAAFVDFGVGRNGFLHVSDVEPEYYRHIMGPQGRRDEGRGQRRGRDEGRGDGPRRDDRGRDDRGRQGRGRNDRDARGPRSRPEPVASEEAYREPAQTAEPFQHEESNQELPLTHEEVGEAPAHVEEPTHEQPATEAEPPGGEVSSELASPTIEAPVEEPPAEAPVKEPRRRAKVEPVEEVEPTEAAVPAEATTTESGEAAPAEAEAAEEKPKRRRARGGRPRRGKAAKEDKPAEDAGTKDDDGPQLMGSTERRTDADHEPLGPALPRPAALVSDEELSFSMARPQPQRPETQRQETRPAPREPEPEPYREEEVSRERAEPQERYQPERAPAAELRTFADEQPDETNEGDDEQALITEIGGDEEADGQFEEEHEEIEEYESRGERSRHGERGDQVGERTSRGPGRGDRGGDRKPRRGGPGRPGMSRPKPLIQDIFRRGQEVIVQVIKEGIGTKGPTLSTYISIAGRYLVLMPGLNRIGVSRKITDEETRRRLRDILGDLRPPKGLGFIIRTAGQDRNRKELQGDLAYLSRLYEVVARRIQKLKSPAEVYQESDMITRTIRDIFTNDIDTIWVDERNAYEHAKEFLTVVMPRYASRIKFWDSTEPMFHKYGIEQEITRIQQRRVPLPLGGSIVIEQTEALVAIDVNSGNFRAEGSAEETAYQMNLHAAKEIARQLRLRDLGGVIVNDFIDMRDEKHRRNVEWALRDAIRRDRARTKVLKISQFGIIEMTRQRIRPSLKRSVYHDCAHCHGTGQVKTCESMSIDVMRLLQLAVHRNQMMRIDVRVHEEVAQYLLNRKRREVFQLEEQGGKQIAVLSAGKDVSPEFLEFVCFDNNNNEVKFVPYEEPRPQPRRRFDRRY